VSLRGRTVDQAATLPDGRHVTVHVGVPEDPYIPRGELETVDVELRLGGRVLAAVNTVLDPDQESEALELARAIVNGLESGELEPTASAIEPLADAPYESRCHCRRALPRRGSEDRRELHEARARRFLRRPHLPPRHSGLHDPGR